MKKTLDFFDTVFINPDTYIETMRLIFSFFHIKVWKVSVVLNLAHKLIYLCKDRQFSFFDVLICKLSVQRPPDRVLKRCKCALEIRISEENTKDVTVTDDPR